MASGGLGPVLSSIMGSEDRGFAHEESMQSASLGAQQSMHAQSLANAMKIAKLQYQTQRYGIDVGKETAFRGQDFEKETAFRGQDVQRYGIDTESETARRGQDYDLLAKRWENALNYLSMASQLKGPENWLPYLNFTRGAQQQGAPGFLASLMGQGGMLQDFGAPGGPAPNATSAQAIAADMGYGGAGPNAQNAAQDQTVGLVKSIANNMHRLGPNALGNLSEDEQNFLLGTASSLGYSVPSLLNQYAQSGVAQGSGRGA